MWQRPTSPKRRSRPGRALYDARAGAAAMGVALTVPDTEVRTDPSGPAISMVNDPLQPGPALSMAALSVWAPMSAPLSSTPSATNASVAARSPVAVQEPTAGVQNSSR